MPLKPFDWSLATPMWAGGGYCDMPYMAALADGALISALTVNAAREGQAGQHVIIVRSEDAGRTWFQCSEIEPSNGPSASWGMLAHDPQSGLTHLFYVYNSANLTSVPNNDGVGGTPRVDSTGSVIWRASRDGGRTWSGPTPVPFGPPRRIDRRNPFGGEHRLFWTTGHPVIHAGDLYLGLARMGEVVGGDMFRESHGFVWRIALDALSSGAPQAVELPRAGDDGIHIAGNAVNEETSPLVFDDGVINLVFRTTTGQLGEAWSTDGGETFEADWARYARDGQTTVKQPRAPAKQFLLPDGRILLWHYNNDWTAFKKHRNPVWYRLGERHGPRIRWGDAYALCFDTDHERRIVYPSLLVHGDELLIAAGDKESARLMRFPLADL